MIRATDIEVGVKGQHITVRGSCAPSEGRQYGNEAEMYIDLSLARELHRLLGKLIPLAEQSKPTATIVSVARRGEPGDAA